MVLNFLILIFIKANHGSRALQLFFTASLTADYCHANNHARKCSQLVNYRTHL